MKRWVDIRRSWPAAVIVLGVALSGCIAPIDSGELDITILLDHHVFNSIQNVTGIVEINNSGLIAVEATHRCTMTFSVERMRDSEVFLSPVITHCDPEGLPPSTSRFNPGETVREAFSLLSWAEIENEFDDGSYGIAVRPFREDWTSDQVLFSIG